MEVPKMIKKKVWLLFLIVLLAAFLRFYQLDKFPPSLFADEVDLGYQAYSFLKTGKDYFGNPWPISFHSFADYRAPLYLYSAVPSIAVLGLNEWGVRFPAALFGVLGVVAFFFLARQMTNNLNFSLLATFVLTILPWHFHYSRAGFEATLIFFLVALGLFLFFKGLKKKSALFLSLSLVSFVLGFYAYATARMLLPLLALVILVLYRKEIFAFGLKRIVVVSLIGFLVGLPFLVDMKGGGAIHRFSYLNIFSDSNLKYEVNRQRLVDTVHGRKQEIGLKPTLTAYLFHSKPLSWTWKILENFAASFSTEFLFLKGDPNLRHGIGQMGGLLLVFAPFLLFGLFRAFSIVKGERDILSAKESLLLISFLFLSPIPASITYDGGTHATRLFLMVLPLVFFITLGFWKVKELFKSKVLVVAIFLVLASLNFVYNLHQYFYHYPLEAEKYWHYGFKQAITKISSYQKDYDKVILSNTYEPPLIFFLFWLPQDPKTFNVTKLSSVNSDWFEGSRTGKFFFGRIRSHFWESYLPSLTDENRERFLILASTLDLGGDLEKHVPASLEVIDKVYLPSGQPIFYLLENK